MAFQRGVGDVSMSQTWSLHDLMCSVLLTDCHALCLTHFFSSSNQIKIKSNHFYCHITTAQVPWWVKFLWACSRQCRKTTDNLHMDRQCKKTTNNLPMDRQCKKTTNNLPMDRQCKKNNKQFTYGQTVQKNCTGAFTVLQTVQKKQQQFTYGQTVQKNNNSNLHMDSTYVLMKVLLLSELLFSLLGSFL